MSRGSSTPALWLLCAVLCTCSQPSSSALLGYEAEAFTNGLSQLFAYQSPVTYFFRSFRSCSVVKPVTEEFCKNPPVVDDLMVDLYDGTWFGLYNSGRALSFAPGSCVTANYTIATNPTDGSTFLEVLNCATRPESEQVVCIRGNATQRADATSPAQLQVSFPSGPPGPPGAYNVAALLGDSYFGYYAAAVYICTSVQGKPEEGFFIIARTPYFPEFVLAYLKEELRCAGYNVDVDFIPVPQDDCPYFFDEGGFVEVGSDGVSGLVTGPPESGPPPLDD